MVKVIILIGIPASGKSSFVSSLVHRYVNPVNIISSDFIRSQLYGSESIQGDWQEIYGQIKHQFQQSYSAKRSVIYDATNCQVQYRQEIIRLVKGIGFNQITGIWLNVPLWICLQRNERRIKPVPEPIILEMYKSLMQRSPSLSEGFDDLMIKDEGTFDDSLL